MPAAPSLAIPAIAAALGPRSARFDVDVLAECGSTNAELLERAAADAPSGSVVVAERQTAGRGRMGRTWHAEPGASLAFSLLWRLPHGVPPAGLSLAAGVALVEALEKQGGTGLALKWPNDILKDGRKLAGILIELVPGDVSAAVIGIGLNLRLPQSLPEELRGSSAALDGPVDPNALLAALLSELHDALTAFGSGGFAALRDRWLAHCAHLDLPVRILSEFGVPVEGRCVGIDVDGALLVETPVCVQRILSGEVSLRFP